MKRFLVHVIDEASCHEFIDSSYKQVKGYNENNLNEECDLLKTDAFYLVSSENEISAAILVADKIKVLKDENKKSLSEVFEEEGSFYENAEIGSENFETPNLNFIKYEHKAYGEVFSISCTIKRCQHNNNWSELHKVYFYVVPETKIISI